MSDQIVGFLPVTMDELKALDQLLTLRGHRATWNLMATVHSHLARQELKAPMIPAVAIQEEIVSRVWLDFLYADRLLKTITMARSSEAGQPEPGSARELAEIVRISLSNLMCGGLENHDPQVMSLLARAAAMVGLRLEIAEWLSPPFDRSREEPEAQPD